MNGQTPQQDAAIGRAADLIVESGISLDQAVSLIRKEVLVAALRKFRGNQCKAAKQLQVHRNTIGRIFRESGLSTRSAQVCK